LALWPQISRLASIWQAIHSSTSASIQPTALAPSAPVYSYQVPSSGYDGVGNLLNYTDLVTGQWSNLGYDGVNRLVAGTQTPVPVNGVAQSPQFFCWSYDSFGNRTAQATSNQAFTNALGAPACQPAAQATFNNAWAHYTVDGTLNTPDNGRNQLTASPAGPFSYDSAGDIVSDAAHSYLYDAEGRLCAASQPSTNGGAQYQYLYDASGARVGKATFTGSFPAMNTTCAAPGAAGGFALKSQYLLDLGGDQVTELGPTGNWVHTNAFDGGRLTATYDNDGKGVHFAIADPLGTKRVQATIASEGAATLDLTCTCLPFGNSIGNSLQTQCSGPGADATEHHFTGKERDAESGNDYFGARYYSSEMGRFMSPDWSAQDCASTVCKAGESSDA
jgi:RHS repeat-associated protein